ncbi:TnsA-like heteromeric transposase endonuclease subunit [Streptomyces sp. MST-110588]|uniref:TnsA-like heteromeric transposase endonuclease subunit n=1 Tax=Streptomyces sp. MST-110588 TaxID=2833628 RepID=UPI001F5D9071|nr:TnsA-like heteromeric transposase endonuclease subunit [Streptomyces sp. MST-110588]
MCWDVRFAYAEPVRPFRWPKGGESFAGWYLCATTGGHIGYESCPEPDRLILLDADPPVRDIASQPFRLHWHDGTRRRRHAPAYFVRMADGRGGWSTSGPRAVLTTRQPKRSRPRRGPAGRWTGSSNGQEFLIRC